MIGWTNLWTCIADWMRLGGFKLYRDCRLDAGVLGVLVDWRVYVIVIELCTV